MNDAVVNVDPTSGNETVLWYLDQTTNWEGSAELHETDEDSDLVSLDGCTARMVVRGVSGDQAVALQLETPTDLVNNGSTIAWNVPSSVMATLTTIYDVELKIFPGGDEDRAELLMDGRIAMRSAVAQATP